jgi:hypothetical protein
MCIQPDTMRTQNPLVTGPTIRLAAITQGSARWRPGRSSNRDPGCYRHRYMTIVRQEWMTTVRQHSICTGPLRTVAMSAMTGERLGTVRGSRRTARCRGTCELRHGAGHAIRRRRRGATRILGAGVGPRPVLQGGRQTRGARVSLDAQ